MNLPTKITFSRIIIIILMIIALAVLQFFPQISYPLGNSGIDLTMLLICVLFLIGSATDWLDGHLARKNNQVTDLGKFLDPVADKLLINSLVIFLIAPAVFAPYAVGYVGFNMWCALLLVARDIVVDALRFIAAQKKIVIAANIFGKLKTVLEMVAITVVLLNGFPFGYISPLGAEIFIQVCVGLATAASLISGIIYVIQNRKVFLPSKDEK